MQALWGQCLQQLVDRNLTPDQIAAALPDMRVDLVLTAHPTEAKRTIVLEHHRNLYLLLVKRENQMWTPYEQLAIREEIKTLLSLLWRTGEIFLHKPDVAAERRNIMHYLSTVFPDVLPVLDRRLRQTWEHLGFDQALLRAPGSLPRFSVSTWVGGDRDGHPLVTADVTRESLDDLRLHGLLLLQRQLAALARQCSLSDHMQPPPARSATACNSWPRISGSVGCRRLTTSRRRRGDSWSGSCWRGFPWKVCTPKEDASRTTPDAIDDRTN